MLSRNNHRLKRTGINRNNNNNNNNNNNKTYSNNPNAKAITIKYTNTDSYRKWV